MDFLHFHLLIALVPLSLSVKTEKKKSEKLAILMTVIAFLMQIGYFILRWVATEQAPVSNMYEFIATFSIMIILGYLITYHYYRTKVLGLFVIPVSLLLIAYGSMFSTDVNPLIPSLQSNWLAIHVITVSISYGVLSMSAVAGLIYLLKAIPLREKSWRARILEMIMVGLVIVLVYIGTTLIMKGAVGYSDEFMYTDQRGDNQYELADHFHTGINLPPVINSQSLNTVIWSVILGLIVYGVLRLILRKRLMAFVKPLANRADLNLMDEIGYRSVIIGFPLFALGGIFFAAIWAQIAWSRFWGWDPKETWAFITFMFYTIFLHLRLNRGYEGEKSAWLALIGFILILFNLIAIHLIVAGLHSYA